VKISVAQKFELRREVSALVVPVLQDAVADDPLIARLDRRSGGHILEAAAQEKFVGKPGQALTFNLTGGKLPRRLCLVGLGDLPGLSGEKYRRAAGVAAGYFRTWNVTNATLACRVPPRVGGVSAKDICGALTEGISLGLYRFEKYKSRDEDSPAFTGLDELELFFYDGRGAAARGVAGELEAAASRALIVAAGVNSARELVNEIPAELTPEALAAVAVELAKSHKGLSCRVLDENEMEREKMGATLAVARGSANPPRFIELSWEPQSKPASDELLVLVGKGVCFDSGGLNIKPGEHMAGMKTDMAGAASVLGAMEAIAALQLPVRVTAVVAAVENMPGGRSYKPDDIVRALDGTTIEIGNTDAEGRLTLADALAWATGKLKADRVVDLATLTGACVVALGATTAGLFGNDEDWTGMVGDAAGQAGEKLCRLPLDEDMRADIRSDFADLKNIGASRWGGAITAALFLQKFAGETPWVHLDIAGPARAEKKSNYNSPGGTGYGVRLLVRLVANLAAKE
jgi:leucyl aminopeptidase